MGGRREGVCGGAFGLLGPCRVGVCPAGEGCTAGLGVLAGGLLPYGWDALWVGLGGELAAPEGVCVVGLVCGMGTGGRASGTGCLVPKGYSGYGAWCRKRVLLACLEWWWISMSARVRA